MKKPINLLLLSIILVGILIPVDGFTQKYLSLENPKKFKRIKFMPGEGMLLQTWAGEEKKKVTGILEMVTDSFLILAREQEIPDPANPRTIIIRDTVQLSQIFSIYVYQRSRMGRFVRMYGNNAIAGGLLLIGGGSIMAALENQRPDETGFMIAGGIMLSGILVKLFTRNKFKPGKNWQVKAMTPLIEGDFFKEKE